MPAKTKDKAMQLQSVYYGDCVKHLEQWYAQNFELLTSARSLADLIYLDPPWNSNEKYNILWDKGDNAEQGFTAQATAFTDIWEWDDGPAERVQELIKAQFLPSGHPKYPLKKVSKVMESLENILPETGALAYLAYMAERLAFCRELLKDTGSIFLHCDPTMSHYLKLVMDAVFGVENFRNEITWRRTVRGFKGSQFFPRKFNNNTDIILFYAKSKGEACFRMDRVLEPYTQEYLDNAFKLDDAKGKYYLDVAFNRKGASARPNLCYKYKPLGQETEFFPPHPSGWKVGKKRMEELEKSGEIVVQNGKLYRKIRPKGGKIRNNLWDDVPEAKGKERRGFETQKPRALLRRIIEATTNPGDVVLDPFCGCGTTVVEAHSLGRQFVGIDISLYNVQNVVRVWLTEEGLKREQIHVAGIPADMAQVRQLAKDDPFAFESFAVELCHPGFKANVHQSRDGGVDGKGILLHPAEGFDANRREVIVQCKAGKPTIDQVRSFAWNITKPKSKAVAGVFITLDYKVDGKEVWTPEMKKIARSLKRFKVAGAAEKYPRLQHWHCARANLRNREETLFEGLPNLPDLAHRGDGEALRKVEISVEQSDFWKGTEE